LTHHAEVLDELHTPPTEHEEQEQENLTLLPGVGPQLGCPLNGVVLIEGTAPQPNLCQGSAT